MFHPTLVIVKFSFVLRPLTITFWNRLLLPEMLISEKLTLKFCQGANPIWPVFETVTFMYTKSLLSIQEFKYSLHIHDSGPQHSWYINSLLNFKFEIFNAGPIGPY